jgi:Prokaryotic metallothionein.
MNRGKAMTTVTQMKCACESCLCVVSLSDAVMKDGKPYCGEAAPMVTPMGRVVDILAANAVLNCSGNNDRMLLDPRRLN